MGQNALVATRRDRASSVDIGRKERTSQSDDSQRRLTTNDGRRSFFRHASTIDVPSPPDLLRSKKEQEMMRTQRNKQDTLLRHSDQASTLQPSNSIDKLRGVGLSDVSLVEDSEETEAEHEHLLGKEDIALLKQTFESVKLGREYLGWKGMLGVWENIPEASQSFKRSPNMPIRKGDNWEIMGQGIVFLSGIERFILRLNHCKSFKSYAANLVRAHRDHYAVSLDNMLVALDIFQNIIVHYLVAREEPETAERITETWSRFFVVLKQQLASVTPPAI